ncbi:MAG: hypothetical protein LRY35_04455 [Clostridiales bacterium]|nr:hypothetical protein [Clostridiales bacterium]
MAETKHQSLISLLFGYQKVFGKVIRSREMRLALVISVILNITSISITNFFALYITLDVGIPEKYVALFPIGRAVIMLLFMFILQPLTNRLHYRSVFLAGFGIYLASHVFLLLSRPDNQLLVIAYTLLEAVAFALVVPRRDALGAVFYDKEDGPGHEPDLRDHDCRLLALWLDSGLPVRPRPAFAIRLEHAFVPDTGGRGRNLESARAAGLAAGGVINGSVAPACSKSA